MNGFEDKRVLITGAAWGIGRATAIGFSALGAKVTIGDGWRAGRRIVTIR